MRSKERKEPTQSSLDEILAECFPKRTAKEWRNLRQPILWLLRISLGVSLAKLYPFDALEWIIWGLVLVYILVTD